MRFVSLLLLGILALTCPSSDAIRLSSHNTLSRLMARVALAEKALAQLEASQTIPQYETYGYTFNNNYQNEVNTAQAGVVIPANDANIKIVSNSVHGGYVFSRTPSASQAGSYLSLPASYGGSGVAWSAAAWLSWSGVAQPTNTEQDVLASPDSTFKLFVSASGVVTLYVNGNTVQDTAAITDTTWYHYAITFDGSSIYTVYKNGNTLGNPFTSSAINSQSTIDAGNNAGGTAGYIGLADDVRIFNAQLQQIDVQSLYTSTKGGAATGQSGVSGGWLGHFGATTITFADQYVTEKTGVITVTGSLSDVTLYPPSAGKTSQQNDALYVRMWGVTTDPSNKVPQDPGTGTNANPASYTVKLGDGTTVQWVPSSFTLFITPGTQINPGQSFSYTIDPVATGLVLDNPTLSNAATTSDSRWKIAVQLDPSQTNGKWQSLEWQGISNNPQTLQRTYALLEEQ
jgi:hypothetical protein